MSAEKNILEIFEVFSNDEKLLRLLFYPSNNLFDDPLDPNKGNILDRSDKWDIIRDRIKFTPTTDKFDEIQKCRICFYAGRRTTQKNNQFSKTQEMIFDVLVHREFQEKNLRMHKIHERIRELLSKRKYNSFGEVYEDNGEPIGQVATDYFGYKVIYLFGDLDDR